MIRGFSSSPLPHPKSKLASIPAEVLWAAFLFVELDEGVSGKPYTLMQIRYLGDVLHVSVEALREVVFHCYGVGVNRRVSPSFLAARRMSRW